MHMIQTLLSAGFGSIQHLVTRSWSTSPTVSWFRVWCCICCACVTVCPHYKLTLWDEKLLLNDRFAASRTIPRTKKTALLLTSVKLHDGGEAALRV